jgi:hypothetical protein
MELHIFNWNKALFRCFKILIFFPSEIGNIALTLFIHQTTCKLKRAWITCTPGHVILTYKLCFPADTTSKYRQVVRLIIYGFTSRSRIFHLYGDVTITGEGLQNLGLCPVLRAFEQGGIFIVPHLLWPRFSDLIRRTAPFSRLLRHMRGCGGSILTRILTGI